jgi:hypothetical protein
VCYGLVRESKRNVLRIGLGEQENCVTDWFGRVREVCYGLVWESKRSVLRIGLGE